MSRSEGKHVSHGTTPAIRKTEELADHLTQKLCREDVFPKRSRWVISGKIADLLNDLETFVFMANEIKVVTQADRDDRHRYLTLARAALMALDVKVNRAQRSLSIPPDKLQHYGKLVKELKDLLQAWETSDTRRYGAPTALEHTEGDGR